MNELQLLYARATTTTTTDQTRENPFSLFFFLTIIPHKQQQSVSKYDK